MRANRLSDRGSYFSTKPARGRVTFRNGCIVRYSKMIRPNVEMGQGRPFPPLGAMSAMHPIASAKATYRPVVPCQ